MTIHFGINGAREDLVETVQGLSRDWYATVDGALVENLPDKLKSFGLIHRALYIEGTDEAAITNGPYLVRVPDARAVMKLIGMTGNGPSPVFWSWAAGEPELVRHLRRKAMVRIPPETPEQRPAWDNVLFRHADANVLATMLEVLTPEQQASFIGKAKAIAFFAPDALGLILARRPIDLPKVERETISFTPEQYARIEENRIIRNRRRVMNYLRRVASRVVGAWDEETLYRATCEAERTGKEVGLRSEYAHWLWAYLCVVTRGEIARNSSTNELINQDENNFLELFGDLQAELAPARGAL